MSNSNGTRLRHFKDVDDLFDSGDATNEQIVAWVNELVELRDKYEIALLRTASFERLEAAEEKRKAYHKKHQEKQRLLLRAANELLQPDEKQRLAERAAEAIAEREIAKRGGVV